MKNLLIASFDMEIGGVERSLINMLEHFDYNNYSVDLMLYKHQGELLPLIPAQVTLLKEIEQYSTFRKSVKEIFQDKHIKIGISRVLSKLHANAKQTKISEPGYYQMQLMWKYALPFLPTIDKEYEIAISYLWPHYFVADKVKAKKKVAWIHTDYSMIETDIQLDLEMWGKFDHIIAVSEACQSSFLQKYPTLIDKVVVVENITSPKFIREMGEKEIDNPLVNDNRFKLVTVARLSQAKGIDNAVHALKILIERGITNIVWYVVGYGGDEDALKNLISKNKLENHFILLGKKTNPYPFMKSADLYVQPSRYEGKAVTVSEAQILGKPVMITNYSTASSQVCNEIDGYICELSVEGIADGVEYLTNHPEIIKKIVTNCKELNFNNEKELEKLYRLIKQVSSREVLKDVLQEVN
ncbi:glycosyltransferase [Jeotgalibacillus campisalis]|uniref:Capsular polysaccharide biosynthesis protein n=1 Tax=Jeotgalibacillus campisalis TaxID=220754 RepID=A0A0C2VVR2_9BACL|nr:glycosyltransferase [Jeotgalibacillus campisalis]KIL52982.1 capsular polysaccharide biosynthesis protein [Jeotgalibacillus campisalis]